MLKLAASIAAWQKPRQSSRFIEAICSIRYKSDSKIDKKKEEEEEEDEEERRERERDLPSSEDDSIAVGSDEARALARPTIPDFFPELLALPVAGRPLFPRFMKPVQIKDEQVSKAVLQLKRRGQPYLGAFLTKDDANDKDRITNLDEIHKVGVLASIQNVYPSEHMATVLLLPHRRVRATKLIRGEPYSCVKVENLKDEPYNKNNPVIKALSQEIIATIKDIAKLSPFLREQINVLNFVSQVTHVFEEPSQLADFCAGLISTQSTELQEILESLVIEERLRKTLILLKKELVNAKLQHEISKEVEDKINKRQREYYLMEQLKNIKKELGLEKDDKEALVSKFREKAAALNMPEAAKKVFDEELSKLQHLETASAEFNVTRNYLDWLTQIPWGIHSEENYDLNQARSVLDADHYGLKDVKERILEFVAVGKLRGSVQGKIICLVGPPGVGKTSIGKSIAKALSRQFFRFSVGGLTDVAEIKGHRRTYIGAMPGKVIQALKKVQTENPLILIDEMDKIGRGHQGDPASALLEMLDPEQNNAFLDHYLDVPVDLSKVLFVTTANVTDTIPQPLLDRMEVIQLAGYIAHEKVAIALKYLIPQALIACGIKEDQLVFEASALDMLIKQYCRESGVRNLQKHIDKIARKAAYKLVEKQATQLVITTENLHDYVGLPPFTSERLYDQTPEGVVMGLAWTSMGGSILYIESVLAEKLSDKTQGKLHLTGKMGDVMKESASIAYTYAKALVLEKYPDNNFFQNASIHLHVPEGAIPKDGPSAGCTMATSLISLALKKPAIPDLAMTGELTLTGKILRIGGVKEKSLAAKRSGVKKILLPESNRKDWEELEADVKEGLDVQFVDHYRQVFQTAFPQSQGA